MSKFHVYIKAKQANNWIINNLLSIFIFFVTITTFSLHAQTTSIMSYNIRYDNPNDGENTWENRKIDLVNLIEFYHPDFLGIQEGLYHQVKYIQKNTSNYLNIGVGRDGNQKGEFSAIYYDSAKFELIEQNTFWLSDVPDTISVGWDAALKRICTYGKFKDKRTKELIHIFNTHFDHRGETARTMSAKLILRKISEYGLDRSKVIIMGDLNALPQSEPIKILKTKLLDGLEVSKKKFYGPKGTFNGFNIDSIIDKRIDYIFITNLVVNRYQHIDDKRLNKYWISDHLPILIEVNNISASKN